MINNLKKARKKKCLTQNDISHLLNVPQSSVSYFENGITKLNEDQIRQLVKVLECSADYLLGLIDDDNKKEHK